MFMYSLGALKFPFRISFVDSIYEWLRKKTSSPPSYDAAAKNTQPKSNDTIDQLVRDLIIVPKGESESSVNFNILMARQWHNAFYHYPQDRATAAWIIADYLAEQHEYGVIKRDDSQIPTEKT